MYHTLFMLANVLIMMGAFALGSLQPVARRFTRYASSFATDVYEDGEVLVRGGSFEPVEHVEWEG